MSSDLKTMKFIISLFIFICGFKLIKMTDDNNKNLTAFNDSSLDSLNFENKSSNISDCIGHILYCNYSKEEYIAFMYSQIYPEYFEWIAIGVLSIVYIVGLVGNTIVCLAVYRNRSMRTVTNYFIVNLAVGDIMTLFCLPPNVLYDVTDTWFLGEAMCKAVIYFQDVSLTASVMTLTLISVDRWFVICFPLKYKTTTGRAKKAIFLIWTVALIFNIPEIIAAAVEIEPLRFDLTLFGQCEFTWSPNKVFIWQVIEMNIFFTLPFLLMTVAYHQIFILLWRPNKIPGRAITSEPTSAELAQLQSRRRAAKILVTLVVMFAVCYLPSYLYIVLSNSVGFDANALTTFMALLVNGLCYLNSAMNPIIFNCLNDKFRDEFRRAFCYKTSSTEDISIITLTRTSIT